ncbi:unnamed protein product [Calicophoron daubneyi]|uniref:Peptide-N(4)-(N-acetyl-beta-glucosaminyl)asparagine amidase n=1 Tax=Calicophoron daubneyi TaxID=300641 RepID=A0AAV2SYX7_CALDB
MGSHPVALESQAEFTRLLEECSLSGKLMLVDFYADWCGPCRAVAPHFRALSEEFSARDVMFVKINSDRCRDLCMNEFVTALPTFKLYKNRECLVTVVGGNIDRLRSLLEKHAINPCVIQMKKFSNEKVRKSAAQALINMLSAIISEPSNADHRRLKLDSPDFKDYILNVPGGMDLLFAAGFEEAECALVLPSSADLGYLKILVEQLKTILSPSAVPTGTAATARPTPTPGPVRVPAGTSTADINRLTLPRRQVAGYLDPEAQAMARSLLPTECLMNRAADKAGCSPDEITPRMFLNELLRWFKGEFFRWADEFKCASCGAKMCNLGTDAPTVQEQLGDASNVELYKCTKDPRHSVYRFPRYNDLKTLMKTRLGRCGEWANCLTLFLVACRRPTNAGRAGGTPWFPFCRYVSDWTDHVWCELWLKDDEIPGLYRWVHCDPGGEVDQPLLYESGWGKRLTYIFAYTVPPACFQSTPARATAAVDIQDVTWRYTRTFSEVCSRRDPQFEPILCNYLTRVHLEANEMWKSKRREIAASYGDSHPFSLGRIIREIASFLIPPRAPTTRLPGRQTGSLEWRRARGELGADDPALQQEFWNTSNGPMRPTEQELKMGLFYLRYNAAMDIYQRGSVALETATSKSTSGPSNSSREMVRTARENGMLGWKSLATRWRNICRKVENDWHMVYLAREEDSAGNQEGLIEWHLDLRNTGYEVGKVSVFGNMICHTPESCAHITLCSLVPEDQKKQSNPTGADAKEEKPYAGKCTRLVPGSVPIFESKDFAGAKFLCLQGRLWTKDHTSVNNPVAWQQAQLFRQKDTDYNIWPLEWKVELVKKSGSS